MKFLIIIGSIGVPVVMVILERLWRTWGRIFTMLALVSFLLFGNISAIAVYEIIRDEEVFMTTIHGIFLNPLFLISGSFIGVFFLYKLMQFSLEE